MTPAPSRNNAGKRIAKERPILFSAPMVRAILAGTKTQTRRVVKPRPRVVPAAFPMGVTRCDGLRITRGKERVTLNLGVRDHLPDVWGHICPYGQPGDRLWVRETFVLEWPEMDRPEEEEEFRRWVIPHYAATEAKPDLVDQNTERPIGWRPSIYMPRWASRITLELTSVRVERVQDISEEDAKAEGLKGITKDGRLVKYGVPDRDGYPGTDDDGWEWQDWDAIPSRAFSSLWDSINAKRGFGWESNPWVWCLTFKRIASAERAA